MNNRPIKINLKRKWKDDVGHGPTDTEQTRRYQELLLKRISKNWKDINCKKDILSDAERTR